MANDVQDEGQLGMDETVIEDEELENLLGRRQTIKEQRADLNADYKKLNERIAGILEDRYEFPSPDAAPLRVGDYRISARDIAARTVQFETEPSTTVSIAKV